MTKFILPDDDDLVFFIKAMQDVKRTKSSRLARPRQKKVVSNQDKLRPIQEAENYQAQTFTIHLFDPVEQTIGAQDRLYFSRPGLQSKRTKQLIRGQIQQSDYLDLHQMTVAQARSAVINFLIRSRKQGYRCVRIIHGKGQLSQSSAKLKNCVNCWLQQISWVLAFSSAQARDGGTGALYVLLRRIR
jgi:DNA-nicking Smr family endonuclease